MIPGNNTLTVCTAVLVDAMQEYLDKRTMGKQVEVTNVRAKSGVSPEFEITLVEAFDEEPKS